MDTWHGTPDMRVRGCEVLIEDCHDDDNGEELTTVMMNQFQKVMEQQPIGRGK